MKYFFRTLILVSCVLTLIAPDDSFAARKRHAVRKAAPAILGVNDPRYAAIVMDPKTGEVLHQQRADERRYPASLTKMMALYLLFDALKTNKISLDDEMRVSDLASMQPQTNINLQPGDTVPVELAIKSIVVRSANDVAIVIAEALGGDVDHFADLMNAKARALGMSNTHFANPNGLPDPDQYTTAKDMAKLGIALKRDFPRYYPYFSTREFSWNGVSYFTHNRVMLRYSGVDGIKTGYIGKSGFNVVTSVVRGGRPLIGVVMGGATGRWRDDRMITLLNTGYTVLASRGQQRGRIYAQNLPRLPGGQEITVQQAANSDEAVRSATNLANVQADRGILKAEQASKLASTSPFNAVETDTAEGDTEEDAAVSPEQLPAAAPAASAVTIALPKPAVKTAATAGKPTVVAGFEWGIQVGAYPNKVLADKAVKQAQAIAAAPLKTAKPAADAKSAVHRARIENLSENQARAACSMLIAKNSPCFIYRAGTQNL